MQDHFNPRMSRRQVVQWFAAASASMAAGGLPTMAADAASNYVPGAAPAFPKGYGTDPMLAKMYERGEVWPLTLSEAQRQTVTTLADIILPADELGPAASEVQVPEFIDEWISAPYPDQMADRPEILEGLEWLEKESQTRFGKAFSDLDAKSQHAICDDICDLATAKPELKKAARFFRQFRRIASGGYYATEAGWKAIGFVGNVTLPTFDGPPPEVLAQVGVEQTVH